MTPSTALIRPKSTPVTGMNISGTGGGGVAAGGSGGCTTGAIILERLEDDLDDEELLDRRLDRTLLRGALEDRTLLLDREDADDDIEDEKDEELEMEDELGALLGIDDAGTKALQSAMVTVSVVTVPPNASARPDHMVFAPTVIPALAMTVPTNVVLAASVVASVGVQNTLHADAPLKETMAPAVDVSAPLVRKMNVPFPSSVSGPPIFIAPEPQYTPAV